MTVDKEKRIFIWLAQTMRRTQFIEWAQANKLGKFSHRTLSRAMDRQTAGERLTARQSGIATIAEDFRKTIEETGSSVAA